MRSGNEAEYRAAPPIRGSNSPNGTFQEEIGSPCKRRLDKQFSILEFSMANAPESTNFAVNASSQGRFVLATKTFENFNREFQSSLEPRLVCGARSGRYVAEFVH